MKKSISFVVVAMLIALSMAMMFSVFAADPSATLTADKTTAKVGDVVTFSVNASGAAAQQSGGVELTIGDGLQLVSGSGALVVPNATVNNFNEQNLQGAFMFMTGPADINGKVAEFKVQVLSTGTSRSVTATIKFTTTQEQASDTVTIAIAPDSVTANPKTVNLDLASQTNTADITVTVAPPAVTPDIVASTSNAKVATVTGTTITAVGKGTATITFTQKGTTLKDTVTVTVTCSHKAQNTVDAKYLKSAGNCVEKAVYYQNCSVCGEKLNTTFEGALDAQNHKGPINTVGAKTATHFEDGYTGDKVCSACQTTTEKGQTITKGAHTWGTTYEHDENQHWQKCTEDDATTEKADHTAGDWEIVEAADIGKAGKMVKKCTVCGYVMATEDIPALKDYTDTKTAEYKEEAPADVVINTKDGAAAAPTSVTIGDKALREGTDYTVDGNKITIKQDVLKTLDNGSYNVEVTFADGVARAALTVTKATPVDNTPANQAGNVPATGIESHLGLWIALLVLAASGIAVISFRKKESK